MSARLDAYGGTALFLAIEQGNWPMVKWFLGKINKLIDIYDIDLE